MIRLEKAALIRAICFCFVLFVPLSWATFIAGSFYRTLTILLAGVSLLITQGRLQFSIANQKLFFAWTMFAAYTAITMFWAESFEKSFSNTLGMSLIYVVVVIFAIYASAENKSKWMDRAWILAGIACAVLFMAGSRQMVLETGRESLIIFGTETDPNEFGGALLIPISLSMHYYLKVEKLRGKILHIALILIEVYIVLATGSRGALLATAVGLVLTMCFSMKTSAKNVIIIIVATLLGVNIFINWILPAVPKDVIERLSLEAILDDGGSKRDFIWSTGIKGVFEGSPIRMMFGYGEGNRLVLDTTGEAKAMHNQFLQVLANYGIVGVILYLNLLYQVFKNMIKRNSRYLGAFWGMMALSMTLSMSPSYKPLWILMMVGFVFNENLEVKDTAPRISKA